MKKAAIKTKTIEPAEEKRETRTVKFGPKASRLRTRIIKAVREVAAERESQQAS